MSIDKVIPLITKRGNEYLIKFEEFRDFDKFDLPIVDVSLVFISGLLESNSLGDLFNISEIILDYILNSDVILYYYCDHQDLKRRDESISPQKYRSDLFNSLFDRKSLPDLVKSEIIIEDKDNGDHYISLIGVEKNHETLLKVIEELEELNHK